MKLKRLLLLICAFVFVAAFACGCASDTAKTEGTDVSENIYEVTAEYSAEASVSEEDGALSEQSTATENTEQNASSEEAAQNADTEYMQGTQAYSDSQQVYTEPQVDFAELE